MTYETTRVGVERRVQRDEVAFGQEVAKLPIFKPHDLFECLLAGAAGVEDTHIEPARSPGHGFADFAQPDDPQRRPEDVLAEEGRRRPRSPAARASVAVARDDVAGCR